MLNIGYFKAQPTQYILKYSGGRLAREGEGLAFFYWKRPVSSIGPENWNRVENPWKTSGFIRY
jgi:hypothetical protein